MSQVISFSTGGGGGGGITTVVGDVGSVTGATIDLFANSGSAHSGSSVSFTAASGTEMDLVVTDVNSNTIIGLNAGNNSVTGQFNTAVGPGCYQPLTTGSSNTAMGYGALNNATTTGDCVSVGFESMISDTSSVACVGIGNQALYQLDGASYTIGLGYQAGSNYTGTESNNIAINALSTTVTGENNTLRLGDGTGTGQQQLKAAFICGIDGVDVGSVATVVTESGNQLGTAVLTAGSGVTITPTANAITISASGGGGAAVFSATVTLLSSQVLTLDTIPVTIVPAQGANTIIMPISGAMYLNYGGTDPFIVANVSPSIISWYDSMSGQECISQWDYNTFTGLSSLMDTISEINICSTSGNSPALVYWNRSPIDPNAQSMINTPIIVQSLSAITGNIGNDNTLTFTLIYSVFSF